MIELYIKNNTDQGFKEVKAKISKYLNSCSSCGYQTGNKEIIISGIEKRNIIILTIGSCDITDPYIKLHTVLETIEDIGELLKK